MQGGALEPQFYSALCKQLGIDEQELPPRDNLAHRAELRQRLADVFRLRSRDEWCVLLEGTDACFAPILDWDEAPAHSHNRARGGFIDLDGVTQPAPALRFSRTAGAVQGSAARDGADSESVLRDWGCSEEEIHSLKAAEII
jgi:alpha-methylacyl-CoA racemase